VLVLRRLFHESMIEKGFGLLIRRKVSYFTGPSLVWPGKEGSKGILLPRMRFPLDD